jgi:hypothetical protein
MDLNKKNKIHKIINHFLNMKHKINNKNINNQNLVNNNNNIYNVREI